MYYRIAKQNLGLGTYQLWSIEGLERYWALVFLLLTFLQYYTSMRILPSLINGTTATTGNKISRFQVLFFKIVYRLDYIVI
ncbi:MAG: hypothetical protein ACTSQO_08805 [Candidatus Helarchaeota archaeon]